MFVITVDCSQHPEDAIELLGLEKMQTISGASFQLRFFSFFSTECQLQ